MGKVYVSDMESNQVIIKSTTMPGQSHTFTLTISGNLQKHIQEDISVAVAHAIARIMLNSVTVINSCEEFSITPIMED